VPRKTSIPAVKPRVAAAVLLLRDGMRPSHVALALVKKFRVTERTTWHDVRAAQDLVAAAMLADLPRIRRELLDHYREIIAEARHEGDHRAALDACDRLAKLCGANEPDRVEVSGTCGVLVVGAVVQDAETWAAAHGRAREGART
jgi:hypothetical protein